MDLIPLHARHASELASLWLAGVRENAVAEPAYAPAVSREQYADILASRLGAGALFGWAIMLPSSSRLAAYLTAEVRNAAPEFVHRRYLSLLDLDVHLAERRKGLGRRLVEAAKRHAHAAGLSSIEVSWVTRDAGAAAFWQRQGFGPYLTRGSLGGAAFAGGA